MKIIRLEHSLLIDLTNGYVNAFRNFTMVFGATTWPRFLNAHRGSDSNLRFRFVRPFPISSAVHPSGSRP